MAKNDPILSSPAAVSAQKGLAPEGDIARQYAVRRAVKRQQAVGRQMPGMIVPPVKRIPRRGV